MAGDWIKVQKHTPRKSEVLKIASALKISKADAFLGCFEIWCWADEECEDGHVNITAELLDSIAGLSGFAHALVSVGWLHDRDGRLEFPNFDRHMSQSAKRRAMASQRMQRARNKCDAPSATKAQPEKNREEKRSGLRPPNPPKAEEVPIPGNLQSPEFVNAWEEWKAYRREARLKNTPRSEKGQLKKLSEIGPLRAIAAIEFSIRQAYTGVYEENGRPGRVTPDSATFFDGPRAFAAKEINQNEPG